MSRSYRFFISSHQLGEQQCHLTSEQFPDLVHQLTKVLRVNVGDVVTFLAAEKNEPPWNEYVYTVTNVDKKKVTFDFKDRQNNENELTLHLELVLCLPNSTDKLRFVLEKAVELGVKHIELVNSDHSRLQQNLRHERLLSIVKEATEQSERGQIPSIKFGENLKQYLQKLDNKERTRTFVAMERNGETNIKNLMANATADFLRIVIGPEGGFSDQEKNFIESSGFPCVSLGKRILRYETAVVVMLGWVMLGNH